MTDDDDEVRALTAGVAMFRDEWDVAAGSVLHMLDEVDFVVVADNGSVDGTRKILDDLAAVHPTVIVVDDPVVAYEQSAKMSRLAGLAAEMGATYIVPWDADELVYAAGGRVREVLAHLDAPVVYAALTHHLVTALDVDDEDPFRAMVWHQPTPAALPKVAFRWEREAVVEMGNHSVRLPSRPALDLAPTALAIRHFPIRSAQHMVRKARNGGEALAAEQAQRAADGRPPLDPGQGAHWAAWNGLLQRHGVAALEAAFTEHWYYLSPVDAGLVRDPAPYRRWQPAPVVDPA